jgi:Na+/proline symporter
MNALNLLDWLVLLGTIAAIVGYGLWKSRGASTADDWLRGKERPSWSTMGLAVMATQASAITFLSVPGQAYDDGMRFVQVYFGLPFAMIFISAFMVPRYYKLNVYTAYEYLEKRFDVRVRVLGALLFLLQRGLSAGVTIYAPAILLSAMLGWPLQPTIVGIGSVVIAYTVMGGATTVSQTQKQQMIVMLGGVIVAGVLAVRGLPEEIGVADALAVAGALGRTEAVTTTFDLKDRYNLWSGVLGGFFLSLAYFGTDQSQVGRYLHGKSVTESRLGLLLNGVLKIPMQFAILLTGVLVFALYQFTPPPLTFNAPLGAQMQGPPPQRRSGRCCKTAGARCRPAKNKPPASLSRPAVSPAHRYTRRRAPRCRLNKPVQTRSVRRPPHSFARPCPKQNPKTPTMCS